VTASWLVADQRHETNGLFRWSEEIIEKLGSTLGLICRKLYGHGFGEEMLSFVMYRAWLRSRCPPCFLRLPMERIMEKIDDKFPRRDC
jgi:hypothetical protein